MSWNDRPSLPELLLDPKSVNPRETTVDVLVIGGGVAGYRAAIEASRSARVLVVTKDTLRESNTDYAQGGVAAVLSEDDTLAAHRDDTVSAGKGLCERAAVELVVSEGPERVRELMDWGGAFDAREGQLDLGLEGGHSRRRVVHAHGDATGLEVMKTLLRRVRESPGIETWEFSFAIDLLVADGRCAGALVMRDRKDFHLVLARSTILATGGSGRVYRETTNPEIATGDGLAMAFRAGARVRDPEFVQFHPTTLYVAGSARHLITEAVRGEGGRLVDEKGERFAFQYHPDGELAPRDVVSRAIVSHLMATKASCVYLDLTHLGERAVRRFPGITRVCALYNIDVRKNRVPVLPSAHYQVGGVEADLDGRASLPGLYAAGEVASSGLHGANRLASNSLLEGLVFGQRAGAHAAAHAPARVMKFAEFPVRAHSLPGSVIHVPDLVNSVRSLMWKSAGIIRRPESLESALRSLSGWNAYVEECDFRDARSFELVNLLTSALLIVTAALWRRESRGTHFRADVPETDDREWRVHSIQRQGAAILAEPVADQPS
jgi:L-aspartate oxidase